MNDPDRLRKIYCDSPSWCDPIKPDDFLVAIGIKQSNSVYHVVEVSSKPRSERITRHHMKVLKSDLITCLKRDDDQMLIPIEWNRRNKKN